MAYRAPLLLDENMIVSRHRGVPILFTSFVLNGLSHNCNLAEGCKDFSDLKIFGGIRALITELGVYGGG